MPRNALEFVSVEFSGIRLCGILWNSSLWNSLEFVSVESSGIRPESSGIRLVEEGEGLLFLLGIDPKKIDPKIIDAGTS